MQSIMRGLRSSVWLISVFLLAFLIRLPGLGQSLWLDESTTAKVAWTIPFWEIPFRFSPGDFHPPTYYLFVSVWSGIFGLSEIALRMPSVIFSLIAGVFVYKTAAIIVGKKTSIIALIVFLFNPLIVYYSQEVRMYMMTVMWCSAALYFGVKAGAAAKQNIQTVKYLLLSGAFCGLGIFTFYGSVFFTLGLGGYLWASLPQQKKRLPSMMTYAVGPLGALLLLIPLLLLQFGTASAGLKDVRNWSLVLGKNELKNIALIPLKLAVGRVSWFPKWQYYFVGLFSAAALSVAVIFGAFRSKRLWYIVAIAFGSAFAISFLLPMMQYFRFLYVLPVVAILAALSKKKWIIGVVVVMSLSASIATVSWQQFHREDWRSLTGDLRVGERVYMILPSSDPILYYQPVVELHELRAVGTSRPSGVITVIPYVAEVYGFDYQRALADVGCVRTEQKSYRGLQREKWNCRSLSGIMNSIVN